MRYLVPTGLYYTKEHEWLRVENKEGSSVCYVGVTDYAQSKLGDVVYVSFSKANRYKKGDVIAELEAYKGVSEVYSPVSGLLLAFNEELSSRPELVNQDPYGKGWIALLRPEALSAELALLLRASDYEAMLVGRRPRKSFRSLDSLRRGRDAQGHRGRVY